MAKLVRTTDHEEIKNSNEDGKHFQVHSQETVSKFWLHKSIHLRRFQAKRGSEPPVHIFIDTWAIKRLLNFPELDNLGD